jgi:ATP adenylyltransferase
MRALHAPWRIEYILGPKPRQADTSVFAAIGKSNEDEANYVIARAKHCYAVLNTHPYNGGHVLIAPYKQASDFDGFTDEENMDLIKLMQRVKCALTKTMNPDGFNIGINLGKSSGAGIEEHLHVHVVPRWTGDTNFMPVIGDTTVLPEALNETAARLRAELCQK